MEQILKQLTVQDGIFSLLFISLLYTFLKSSKKVEERLETTERYVRNTLLDVLTETREVLSHSTKINELAVKELVKINETWMSSPHANTNSEKIDLAELRSLLYADKNKKNKLVTFIYK